MAACHRVKCLGRLFAHSRPLTSRCLSTEASTHPPTKTRELRKMKAALYAQNRHDPKMEREARMGTLKIPLDLSQEEWLARHGAASTRDLARHCGIFEHVFGGAEFVPQSNMKISFGSGCNVHHGHLLTPTQAHKEPAVQITGNQDSLWTLLLTNPDGNLICKDGEMLHWMVGNIPGGRVQDGEVLVEYLPPMPPNGTGIHRFVFCLLQQSQELDFEASQHHFSRSLLGRNFSTVQLLASYPGQLTPVGLKFFQSKWDESVSQTFQDYFGLEEPVYQPKPFITPRRKRQTSTKDVFEKKYRNK